MLSDRADGLMTTHPPVSFRYHTPFSFYLKRRTCCLHTPEAQLQGAAQGEVPGSRTHRLARGLNRQPPD